MVIDDSIEESIIEYSEDVSAAERPDPLPINDYKAVIREAKKKTSQKGARYANVMYFISADEYPADYTDGNPDGMTLSGFGFSIEDTPRGRFAAKQFHENIGLPAPGKRLDLNQLIGVEVKLTITHELYDGHPQARIARVSRAD